MFTLILTNIMISIPIYNLSSGKRFIRYLVDNHLDYHLEMDADNIFYYHNLDGSKIESGKRVFTNWQAKQLDERADELYDLSWGGVNDCPIGYMLDYQWVKERLNESR